MVNGLFHVKRGFKFRLFHVKQGIAVPEFLLFHVKRLSSYAIPL